MSPSPIQCYPGEKSSLRVEFEHHEPMFAVEAVYSHSEKPASTFVLEGNPELVGGSHPTYTSDVKLTGTWDDSQYYGLYALAHLVFYNSTGGGFIDEPYAVVGDFEWPVYELLCPANTAKVTKVEVYPSDE